MKSKILITGVAGFLGNHLADLCVDNGHEVWGIDDLSGGDEANVNQATLLAKADIRDFSSVETIFREFEPDIVYHLAANAAENKSQFCPMDITSRNFQGSINVLTSAIRHKVKRIVFTSSIAVYGALQTPFKETDKPEPEDLYGITKLAFEESLKVMSKVHGIEYVIARPHNCYGPRQNMTDPYRNVVTIFMNSILRGKPYSIYGDGEQRRCFSYVADVVEALYKCGFGEAGKIFNIGADKDYSVNELSNVILSASGGSLKPVYLKDRPQEVKVAIADHALAKKYLSYEDTTSLEEGIKKTWEWCKKQGYQKPVYTDMEIPGEKMPKNWRSK